MEVTEIYTFPNGTETNVHKYEGPNMGDYFMRGIGAVKYWVYPDGLIHVQPIFPGTKIENFPTYLHILDQRRFEQEIMQTPKRRILNSLGLCDILDIKVRLRSGQQARLETRSIAFNTKSEALISI